MSLPSLDYDRWRDAAVILTWPASPLCPVTLELNTITHDGEGTVISLMDGWGSDGGYLCGDNPLLYGSIDLPGKRESELVSASVLRYPARPQPAAAPAEEDAADE